MRIREKILLAPRHSHFQYLRREPHHRNDVVPLSLPENLLGFPGGRGLGPVLPADHPLLHWQQPPPAPASVHRWRAPPAALPHSPPPPHPPAPPSAAPAT